MIGKLESMWRYPVKGFTAETLDRATLAAGDFFPCDRLFAIEDGPSGFDPAAPAWIAKQRFTVLAKIAAVARARTAYDEASGVLVARADGQSDFCGALDDERGRDGFAAWLTTLLRDDAAGTLKVVQAPGHRFTDHPSGFVSILNLASVRDFEGKVGRRLDPLRFRANLHVEGWPPWVETQAVGRRVRIGGALARVTSQIVRCAATHVDPTSAQRDFDLVPALFEAYGHRHCGVYVALETGAAVAVGDPIELLET